MGGRYIPLALQLFVLLVEVANWIFHLFLSVVTFVQWILKFIRGYVVFDAFNFASVGTHPDHRIFNLLFISILQVVHGLSVEEVKGALTGLVLDVRKDTLPLVSALVLGNLTL